MSDRNAQTSGNGQKPPEHPPTGEASAPKDTDDLARRVPTEPDALKALLKQFRELAEYFSYYVRAKADSVKVSLRYIVLWIGLAALGFVAVAGLIISASWLALSGAAEGLGVLFGDRVWAGNMTIGLLLLAALGLGTYFGVSKQMKSSWKRTVQRYEERQAKQREEFGRAVSDQAAAATSAKK